MNTALALLACYESPNIPLEKVAMEEFGLDKGTMMKWARDRKYPFRIYRLGNQKSPWFVNVNDYAAYIDQKRKDATNDAA